MAIGKLEDYKKYVKNYNFAFVGVGNNGKRMELLQSLIDVCYQIPVIYHSTAIISASAQIEIGPIVCANAVINSSVIIKKGVIISVGAIVDHYTFVCGGSHIDKLMLVLFISKSYLFSTLECELCIYILKD